MKPDEYRKQRDIGWLPSPGPRECDQCGAKLWPTDWQSATGCVSERHRLRLLRPRRGAAVTECDLCFQPTRNRKRDARGQLLCSDCRQSFDYYAQLTPADWLAEYLAMALYTDRDSL